MAGHDDLPSLSVCKLSELLNLGTVSSREITESCLARIEQLNPSINAVITTTPEAALDTADAADQRRAAGDANALTGIPLLYKDIFCTRDIATTCGSRMLENFRPPYDATVVKRLSAAGMVTLGKTNMDEFAMGSSNETSYFGPCRNPWDIERVPGGSSGGSAAAVASGMSPIAMGTDTGGSIRQPAALCGITGLKPTYGRVSRLGMIAYASSLDQAGPMGRSARDCALLLQAMAGSDPADSTSAEVPVPNFSAKLDTPLAGLRVGLPKEYFGSELNPEVGQQIHAAIKELESLGATLKEIELPHTHQAIATYYVIAPAEASANLSRYDGVRFGHRCEEPEDLQDLYLRSRSEGFGEEVKRRILVGTYALSAGFYDAYFKKAQQVRRIICSDFQRAFETVDVIAGPAAPSVAFKLGEKSADPLALYLEDVYTLAVNLAGLPAISLPAGLVQGLPVGLQLIGQAFDEATLLQVGNQLQQQTDWHQLKPTQQEVAS